MSFLGIMVNLFFIDPIQQQRPLVTLYLHFVNLHATYSFFLVLGL